MLSSKNKANLTAFLCESWCDSAPDILEIGQVLVLAGGFKDSNLTRAVTKGNVTSLNHLQSTQEEADTRMLLHAADASNSSQNIVIW